MVFGALLELDGTHAHEALGRVLGSVAPPAEIRNSYYEWLAEGGDAALSASWTSGIRAAGRRILRPRHRAAADPQARPPYLVAVEAASGVRGTGIATRAGVVTATSLLGDSREALLFADEGSTRAELLGAQRGRASAAGRR